MLYFILEVSTDRPIKNCPEKIKEAKDQRSQALVHLKCVSMEFPVWSYQYGATSMELIVWSYQIGVTSYQYGVMSYQYGVTNMEYGVTSMEL